MVSEKKAAELKSKKNADSAKSTQNSPKNATANGM